MIRNNAWRRALVWAPIGLVLLVTVPWALTVGLVLAAAPAAWWSVRRIARARRWSPATA